MRHKVYYECYRSWFRGEYVQKEAIIIVAAVDIVYSLAVDWVHNNLYWVQYERNTVEMSTIDGLYRRTLFRSSDGMYRPSSIVVDPSERCEQNAFKKYLFFV